MKALIGGGAFTFALLLAGCGDDAGGNGAAPGQPVNMAPLEQVEAPNGDWTQMVSETAEGGYLMGNPNAPVKLVEYGSFSCPHCAEFAAESAAELKNEYVKSGQVSFEFRPFLLGPQDVGISMLLRCQGPGPFFRLSEQLFADQRNWMQGFQNIPPAELQRIEALPAQQRLAELTKASGVTQFFRQRGMPEQKINACLADPAGLTRLTGITQKAVADIPNFPGTPTFLINGEMVENAGTWEDLEPKLREAIG